MGLLSTVIFLGLGLFGHSEEKKFESAAAKDIAGKLLGDSKVVSLNVRPDGLAALQGGLSLAEIKASRFSLMGLPLYTEPDRSRSGRVDLLKLRLTEFELRGLKIKELSADIPDCRYDFQYAKKEKKIRLSESGIGRGLVQIREEDLANYIVYKFKEIKNCSVKIYNGVVWVEGTGEFLVVKTDFAVIAKIGIMNGTQLNLTDAKIYFDWRRADAFSRDALLKTLNPIVDLKKDLKLLDAISVDKVILENGILQAEGKTKIPIQPADN